MWPEKPVVAVGHWVPAMHWLDATHWVASGQWAVACHGVGASQRVDAGYGAVEVVESRSSNLWTH